MVRIQRFVLALLLTSSVAFTGCANTRNRFASLWRRGADDSFSESIVDNRTLPKSAREMADSVQDSLRDSADDPDQTLQHLADSGDARSADSDAPRKRYTESTANKRIDELDHRIDDVITRAKSRKQNELPKSPARSDFPEDPFLNDYDTLADKSADALDELNDPVLNRLASAKQKLAASRNPFGDTPDVAERLIKTAEKTVDVVNDAVNPFESLANTTPDRATSTANNADDAAVDQLESAGQQLSAGADTVASTTDETTLKTTDDELADGFPNLEFPAIEEAMVARSVPNKAASPTTAAQPVTDQSTNDVVESDEFDLLFAEAKPVEEPIKRSFQGNPFRPASALRSSDSVSSIFGDSGSATKKPAVKTPETRDEFDRMIIDSDELPQKQQLQPKPVQEVLSDKFTGAHQQLDTYDDFFEADPSVRANQPGDATLRDANPFSFAEPVRETNIDHSGSQHEPLDSSHDSRPVDQPESDLVSPFEELDDEDSDIPVAATESPSPFDAGIEQPATQIKLATQPSTNSGLAVVRISGNTATANQGHELQALGVNLKATPLPTADSAFDPVTGSNLVDSSVTLPDILPGETANSTFNNEPFVDLSAVTQTPLENVAWEVEPDTSIGPVASRTSPWIAWIAVALCSIALILLLRPATNRIS